MCGIAFILDKNNCLDTSPIEAMLSSMNHRGPDGKRFLLGNFKGSTFYIGHNTLHVLSDENSEQQPLNDGSDYLSYNGAIYNYKQLDKNALTDTDVLFSQLREKKTNCLADLHGMFAFVFVSENEVILARDQFGVKPLYYFENEKYLIVGSETKAIFATGLVEKMINSGQAKYFLKYKHTALGKTLFEGIKELLPQSYLTYSDKCLEETIYKIPAITVVGSLKDVLLNSVETQLQSKDKQVGLMLSGGIDSTLLLAMIRRELGLKNFPVFSTIASGMQDASYSRKASDLYDAEYHHVSVGEEDVEQLLKIFHPDEEPIADMASLNTILLSEQANNQDVSVLLSGAGADELFIGYNRHRAYFKYLSNRNVPYSAFQYLPFGGTDIVRKLKKLGKSIDKDPIQTYLNFVGLQWDINTPSNTIEQPENLMNWALNQDTQNYLVKDILAMTDKMSMLHGIETRVPYLDTVLYQYAREQSASTHLQKGTKTLLKELLTSYGGEVFCQRKKEGFGFSFRNYVKKDWFDIEASHQIFLYLEYEHFRDIVSYHFSGQEDYSQELVAFLILKNVFL